MTTECICRDLSVLLPNAECVLLRSGALWPALLYQIKTKDFTFRGVMIGVCAQQLSFTCSCSD